LENTLDSIKTKLTSQQIEVHKQYCLGFSVIPVDKEQISRAFSNIMLNALESMPDRCSLTIVTEIEGNFFTVKIQDTGEGILEEDIIRIFDPFFSTKSSGVGLGLSICYGIIVSHGGTIGVESETNKGTTFTISLPIR
jgi:signal transduction histidine kinase